MRLASLGVVLLLLSGVATAQSATPAFPSQIKHVVVIVQENRTPDNLFQGLSPKCPLPSMSSCSPVVSAGCYDISPCGLSNESGAELVVPLSPILLTDSLDPPHSHKAFEQMCDPDPVTLQCHNDGAFHLEPSHGSYAFVQDQNVKNYNGQQGTLLGPYLAFAQNYGWANFMYQTNQGPSYPAHQFLFSGTSALSQSDDANSKFLSGNFNNNSNVGCLAPATATSLQISPLPAGAGTLARGCTAYDNNSVAECPISNTALVYPTDPVGSFCVGHESMADLLFTNLLSWKYYAASPGFIWTAPNAFQAICQPQFVNPTGDPTSPLECTGAEWKANVDTNNLGTDILRDITNCNLSNVSWVIPNGSWSDHPPTMPWGPSWVAAIINEIGNQPTCGTGTTNAGEKLWNDTVVVVTWDDWGGWSDNQPANILAGLPCTSNNCQGDYQYGFRVPFILVSAYTKAGTINNNSHDFGSILRMIEGIFNLGEGKLGFADNRSTTDLREFFNLSTARSYSTVFALKDANFFLNQTGPASAPDTD
jgi:phospholipase C